MAGPISVDAAREFSTGFYRSLASGKSLRVAFHRGRQAVSLAQPAETNIPRLCCRDEVDPSSTYIFPRGGAQPETHVRVTLTLEGRVVDVDMDARQRMTVALRNHPGDFEMVIESVQEGSVVLTLLISKEGADLLEFLVDSGELKSLDGLPVVQAGDVLPNRVAVDPDLELLEAWREGDMTAAKILLSRYFAGVRLYFLQRVSLEHEDLVQETFTRLVEVRERFRAEAPFRVYLFAIAQNVLYGHLRARYKLEAAIDFIEIDDSIVDLTGRRHSSLLAEKEEHRLLLDALRQLPLRYQELLELYYWQNMTGQELAELFHVSEATIRNRLRAALDAVRRRYQYLAAAPHQKDIDAEHVVAWLEELGLMLERRKSSR